jgi:prepilin signal peptidase PulO-like enzyme (type II secretory pathway)
VELVLAVLVVVSYIFWPFNLSGPVEWATFITWVIALVPMVALVIYDLKWMEMPTRLIYVIDVIALVLLSLSALSHKSWSVVVSGIVGALLIGGLFWIIYQVSNGKWIGGGDVRFGFAMGALLGWQKALFGLALASYLGTALIIVLLIIVRYHRKMRLTFGPFLISALYMSMLFGQQVIDWYKSLVGF